nr:hypothetical protein B0A51_14401 [Rachicladosporium sp. CCFEE 5018]
MTKNTLSPQPNGAATPASLIKPFEVVDRGTGLMCTLDSLTDETTANARTGHVSHTYPTLTNDGVVSPSVAPAVTSALMQDALQVLQHLTMNTINQEELVSLWYDGSGMCANGGVIARSAWQAVHDVIVPLAMRSDSMQDLSTLAQSIFTSTWMAQQWPAKDSLTALEEAYKLNGPSWAAVGMHCFINGMALSQSRASTQASQTAVKDYDVVRRESFDACLKCINFCERFGHMNELTLCLLLRVSMLVTWCYGDDTYLAWRLTGDVSSMIFALGYHEAQVPSASVPPYLVDYRGNLVAMAYEVDKQLATFTGRPPRLPRRYLTVGLSFNAMQAVQVTGFPTSDDRNVALRYRYGAAVNEIREDALDLCFGGKSSELVAQVEQLMVRASFVWASLPGDIKYTPAVWQQVKPMYAIGILELRINLLYSEFLLGKLVMHHSAKYRDGLVQTSQSVLSLVVSAFNQTTIQELPKHRIDLEWWTVLYAMPCASILVLELFRSIEQPNHPAMCNRSAVIRDLSVLVSCCDWLVEPNNSNYALCKQAQSVFSKSLDRIINHSAPVPVIPAAQTSLATPDPSTTDAANGAGNMLTDDPEWLAWLDTIDLDLDPWLDQPGSDPTLAASATTFA